MSDTHISKPGRIKQKLSAWLDTTIDKGENVIFIIWVNLTVIASVF